MPVTDLIELNVLMARVKQAQALYAQFTQAQVDVIFRSAALAAANARIPLARLALTETGMGVFEDKVVKTTLPRNTSITSTKTKRPVVCYRKRTSATTPPTFRPSRPLTASTTGHKGYTAMPRWHATWGCRPNTITNAPHIETGPETNAP